MYEATIQILHLEVRNSSREVTSIVIDGHNLGACYPNGVSNCEFYNCSGEIHSINGTRTIIEPKNKTIGLEIHYRDPVENGSSCFCKTSDDSCSKSVVSQDSFPVTAIARVMLTQTERNRGEWNMNYIKMHKK